MSLIDSNTGGLIKYSKFVNRTPRLHPMNPEKKAFLFISRIREDVISGYMSRITEGKGDESRNAERELLQLCLMGPKKLFRMGLLNTVGWRRGFTK